MLNSLLDTVIGGAVDSSSTGSVLPTASNTSEMHIDIGAIIGVVAIFIGSILISLLICFIIVKLYRNHTKKVSNQSDKTKQPIQYNQPTQNPTTVQYTQPIQNTPQGQTYSTQKSSGGFLKVLGIILIIALIIGGTVFIGKCAYKIYVDNNANSDGNPVTLNRAATNKDIRLEQSFEATVTSLKDSYKVTPNVDIKNLEITFKFYDSSNNLVSTYTAEVGNVIEANTYTVSVSHYLSDIFKIHTYQYFVSGGTVSYFS